MTTLNTIGSAQPDRDEVADAALAMADYDAKSGDYTIALDWLAAAAQHRSLSPEYRAKKAAWENSSVSAVTPEARRDAVTAAALTVIRRALVEGAPVTREGLEREACISLAVPRDEAIRELDAVAQRLGVSALT
jgi:hypothetical protein